MSPLHRASLALAIALLGGGCHDATPPLRPHPLDGMWYPAEVVQPPSSLNAFVMELTVRGDSVFGTGRWGDVPGPRGDVTVRGTVLGDAVTLDIRFSSDVPTFAPRVPQRFVGTLSSGRRTPNEPGELRGTLYETDTARPYGYVRGILID
jgi:hypothetical protein